MKDKSLALLLASVAAFAWAASSAVQTNGLVVDEPAHIAAGISYWDLGRFSIYSQNPPLLQAIAGLPAWLLGGRVDYSQIGAARSETKLGQAFLADNHASLPRIVPACRYTSVLLGLGGGILLFVWASKLAGCPAGAVVAALWLLDPNVVALSSIITTDVGAAVTGGLACYCFWRFLLNPGWPGMLCAGIALGLAVASKFSLIALYPAWVVLAIGSRVRPRLALAQTTKMQLAGMVLLIVLTSLLVVNLTYVFDGSLHPIGGFKFRSRLLSGVVTRRVLEPPTNNRFRDTPFADFPVPFPREYVLGLDLQKWDAEIGLTDVRRGAVVRGGHWYSPLRTLWWKVPPGTLMLFVACAIAGALPDRRFRLATLLPLVSALSLLGLLATQTGLNWPVRYALPSILLLMASMAIPLKTFLTGRWGRAFVVICLGWNLVEFVRSAACPLSYSSPIAGLAGRGGANLGGSNFDWGQDVGRLRLWHDANPSLRPLRITFFGPTGPEFLGLPEGELPRSFLVDWAVAGEPAETAGERFYWAVSSNFMNGMAGAYSLDDGTRLFARLTPGTLRQSDAIVRVGGSIFVFRVDRLPNGRWTLNGRPLDGCIAPFRDDALGPDAMP